MYQPLLEGVGSRPEIAATLVAHVRAVTTGGSVSRRTKELCALMVSWLNACEYCTSCHEDLAERLGIDRPTLDELGNFARSDCYSLAERAALAAAVSLTREPRALPPTIRAGLRAHFDEGEIVEIVAAIGLYNYLNRLSNALELGAMLR